MVIIFPLSQQLYYSSLFWYKVCQQ